MSEVLEKVREKYPAYESWSDDDLAFAIGTKYPVYRQKDGEFDTEYRQASSHRLAKETPSLQPVTTAPGISLPSGPVAELRESLPQRFAQREQERQAKEEAGATESLVGIGPGMVPAGRTVAGSAASAVGKTAAGAVGYATSPQGLVEQSLALAPFTRPFVMAKWAKDMIQGAIASGKDAVEEFKSMIADRINRGIMSVNNLPPPPEGTIPGSQEHIQKIAEDAVNMTVGSGLGLLTGMHAIRQAAPLTARALEQTTKAKGAPSARTEIQEQTPSQVPPVERQPVERAAEGQTKAGTPLEKGEDQGLTPVPSQTFKPAIRLVGGGVVEGKLGQVHNDVIADNKLTTKDIDQRGFTDQNGVWHDREETAAAVPGIETKIEPGRAHASEVAKAQEAVIAPPVEEPPSVPETKPSEARPPPPPEKPVTTEAPAEGKSEVDQAEDLVRKEGKASVSLLQRRLKFPYSKATAVMSELEKRGVVGPSRGPEPREIFPKQESAAPPISPEISPGKEGVAKGAEGEAMPESKAVESPAQFVSKLDAYSVGERENIQRTIESNPNRPELAKWKKRWLETNEIRRKAKETAEPPLPSKTVQYSIDRVLKAIDTITSQTKKGSLERAFSTLYLHGSKLGIPVGEVGTYFSVEKYREIARNAMVEVGKKFGSHPTAEMRAKRDTVLAEEARVKAERKAKIEGIPATLVAAPPATEPVAPAEPFIAAPSEASTPAPPTAASAPSLFDLEKTPKSTDAERKQIVRLLESLETEDDNGNMIPKEGKEEVVKKLRARLSDIERAKLPAKQTVSDILTSLKKRWLYDDAFGGTWKIQQNSQGKFYVERTKDGVREQFGGVHDTIAQARTEAVKWIGTETKAPEVSAESSKPSVVSTAQTEAEWLTVPVPDVKEAEEAALFAKRQVDALRKQADEARTRANELEKKVTSQRGPRWKRGQIKASAKAADVKAYREAQEELTKLHQSADAIIEASRKDTEATNQAERARFINDTSNPLIERMGRRDEMYEGAAPAAFTKAFDAEARAEVLRKYPDATEEEIAKVLPILKQTARFASVQSSWQLDSRMNINSMRQGQIYDAYKEGTQIGIWAIGFPEELQTELSQILGEGISKYLMPKESLRFSKKPISALDVGRVKSEMKKASDAILAQREQERLVEESKKAEEEKQITLAEQQSKELMAEAQKAVAGSGPRTAKAIKDDLLDKLDKAISDAPEKVGDEGKLRRVAIGVPGDGVFVLSNDKVSLKAVRDRAKSISTVGKPKGPSAFSKTQTPKPPDVGPEKDSELQEVLAEEFVAPKDSGRFTMESVWSDGKRLIGTDGRVVTEIVRQTAGDKIEPEGFPLEGVQGWLDKIDRIAKQTVATEDLWRGARMAQRLNFERAGMPKVDLWVDEKGAVFMETVDDEGDYGSFGTKTTGMKKLGRFDADYLESIAQLARKSGNENVKIGGGQKGTGEEAKPFLAVKGDRFRSLVMAIADVKEKAASTPPSEPEAQPAETRIDQPSVQDVWRNQYAAQIQKLSAHSGYSGLTEASEAIRTAEMLGLDKSTVEEDLLHRGMTQANVDYALKNYSPKEQPTEGGKKGIVGMGGAVPSEFEVSPQTPTSIKNATVDVERSQRGLPAAIQPARRAFGEVWDRAMAMVDRDPGSQDDLIDSLREKPRALTDIEDAMLLHRQIDLQNEYGKATRDLAQAYDDGRDDAVAEEKIRVARLSDQLLDIYNIGKKVGTETGRGLNARKLLANEDFTLAKMALEARLANNGEPLSDARLVEIQELHDKIQATQKAYDDYVASTKERLAKLEIDKVLAEQKAAAAPTFDKRILAQAEKIVKGMETAADAASKRLRDRLARLSAGVDPGIIYDAAVIGSARIARFGLDLAKLTDQMVKDFGDKIRPLMPQIWEESNKMLDALTAKAPEAVRRVVRKADLSETMSAVQENIADKVRKGQKDKITHQIGLLARALVQSGITERERLIDAVHDTIKDVIPGITRRETMDAISGYGDYKQLSKDQISVTLRGMKGEMQQLAKLEDMAAGEPPLKSGVERRTPTEAERKLIKEVNDAKNKFQVPVQDPEIQLKSALDTLKTTLRNRISDYEERIRTGDYAKRPRREIVLDPEASRLKAENERVKKIFQRGVALERLKNATRVERTGDWIVKWRRGFILSSIKTLGKLTTAAMQRTAITPAEEVIGGVISKAIPEVAKRAPREGGLNVKAEAKAISEGLVTGMKDAWKTLRTGQSDLDVLYGKEALLPPAAIDFFGHVHGALKAPVKRAEFARSLEKRTQHAIASGVDLSDPLVQSSLVIDSYKDANRAIFQQDNRVVTAYKRALQSLEAKEKATGKPPVSGKLAATTARVLLPIVKIPTNIVAETMQYATGSVTGSVNLARAFSRGIENLAPEEADLIMRQLKKGSLGAAVLALGYLSPEVVGGYYQPGQKRPEGTPKPGTIQLYGVNIPSWALHNPLIETLQIGATIRRVADSKLRKNDTTNQGVPAGIAAGIIGLGEEVPFIREMWEVSKALNPHERGAFFGELGKSMLVPQFMQQIAQWTDPLQDQKRKPQTILQHIEMGIPGLREDVPVASRPYHPQ